MSGTYDIRLVALSYLVAVFASYTALDLAARVSSSRGRARMLWLSGGAVALGIGIWSMHFVGMLAFMLPVPMNYDVLLVLLSLLIAIGAAAGALYGMGQAAQRPRNMVISGFIIGGGIAAMHYTGMAAMEMPATTHYQMPTVLLSIAIAISAGLAALWLGLKFQGEQTSRQQSIWKLVAALVMGLAITGMHYTGMAAAHFTPAANHNHTANSISQVPLGVAIGGATLILLGFALLAALVDRRFALQNVALAESSHRYQSLFQHHSDAVLTYDLEGSLIDANPTAQQLTGYSLAELQHSGFEMLLTPEDAQRMAEAMHAATKGQAQSYDFALRSANGDTLLMNVRNIPIFIADKLVGVYTIGTNITERERVVRTLQNNEIELRTLVERQQQLLGTIQQLSTPVLPLHQRVLLFPLVGQLDTQRSEQFTQVLLSSIAQHRASFVIIDVTGASMLDTTVAHHLLQATRAAQLLGTRSVLVGITPPMAATLVDLGVDFGSLTTRNDLQAGVAFVMAQLASSSGPQLALA